MVLKEYAAIDIETKDGKTYSVDESGIIRDSLTTSSSCSSSGGIPAGSCNAGTISVSFRPPAGLTYSKQKCICMYGMKTTAKQRLASIM